MTLPSPTAHTGEWVAEAAILSGVHPRRLYRMQNILDHGSEEVIAHAKAGTLSIRRAEQLATQQAAHPTPTLAPTGTAPCAWGHLGRECF
jgi:hypothetical protein